MAIIAIALGTTSLAFAEPSPADVETARGLYVEGLQLRDAGKLDVSLARFKAAHALAATPITTLELGRAHVLLAELVEAREVLLSVARLPVQAGESAKAANARVEAQALAEQLRERIPAIQIVFASQPAQPPHVTVDGATIPPEALATPRKVNPGPHAIVAESNGARANANVLLVEREVRVVMLTLGPAAAAPGTPTSSGPAAPVRDAEPARSGPGPWFYTGLVTAGAGVIVGTITGALALSKASTLESECTGSACPRSAADDLSTSRTMGVVSTIAFSIAGAGAVIAIIAWVARPSVGTPVRAAPNGLRWSW
jgi:hypothetical protein